MRSLIAAVTLVLCLTLTVSAKRDTKLAINNLKDTPNYYVYALQQCTDGGQYSIHGLWPQWDKKSWPQYCNRSEPFNYAALQSIVPQLQQNWPSCNGDMQSFLSHEWDKHGTCTPWDELTYFTLGLSLYTTVNWQSQCSTQSKGLTYKECEIHIDTPTAPPATRK
jgi:ribonuclease T2